MIKEIKNKSYVKDIIVKDRNIGSKLISHSALQKYCKDNKWLIIDHHYYLTSDVLNWSYDLVCRAISNGIMYKYIK